MNKFTAKNLLLEETSNPVNQCRVFNDGDGVQVSYAVRLDDEEHHCDIETRNLTRLKSFVIDFEERGESEITWQIDVTGDNAELRYDGDSEGMGFDIHQIISPQTCLQLANMFIRAAETLIGKKEEKRIEEERIKKIIDSQALPFE